MKILVKYTIVFFRCEAISASDYVQFSNHMIDSTSHRYCGQLKELQVTSQNNFLRVIFKSNDRLDGTGFNANYRFLRETDMENIIMPNCVWRISKFILLWMHHLFFV